MITGGCLCGAPVCLCVSGRGCGQLCADGGKTNSYSKEKKNKINACKRHSFPTHFPLNNHLLPRTGVRAYAAVMETAVHFPLDALSNTGIGSQPQYLQGNSRAHASIHINQSWISLLLCVYKGDASASTMARDGGWGEGGAAGAAEEGGAPGGAPGGGWCCGEGMEREEGAKVWPGKERCKQLQRRRGKGDIKGLMSDNRIITRAEVREWEVREWQAGPWISARLASLADPAALA